MGVNSLPRTVTRQRRGCDLNPGPTAPESSTLTTRLLSSQCNSARQAAETRPCSLCVVLLFLIGSACEKGSIFLHTTFCRKICSLPLPIASFWGTMAESLGVTSAQRTLICLPWNKTSHIGCNRGIGPSAANCECVRRRWLFRSSTSRKCVGACRKLNWRIYRCLNCHSRVIYSRTSTYARSASATCLSVRLSVCHNMSFRISHTHV